jgi:uncharacterized membrane protein YgdD (TMEM256/DUF423 family)
VNSRKVTGVAGVLLASGIIIGASSTHALRSILDERQMSSLDTAVDYQLLNALGLLVIGVLMGMPVKDGTPAPAALGRIAALLLAGILCFSGGIYLMLLGAPSLLGLVTPIGGLLMIVAWIWFAAVMLRRG